MILEEDRFVKAMRTYVDEWAFKHPQPADFYRTIEEVSGEQLAWFWRGWFESTEVLDQAVTGVEATPDGAVIHLRNDAGLVMPVLLEVELADGRVLERKLPVEIWARSDAFDFFLDVQGAVVRVTLDAAHQLPDVDRSDNVWRRMAS